MESTMPRTSKLRPQITRQQIVEEALSLLLERSLSGLKMRELADRLGIKAASLYWHFPNKAALEAALSEHLFLSALENTPDAADWQGWMRGLGRSVWDNLQDFRESGLLIMSVNLSEEQFQRTVDAVRSRLSKYDVDQELALRLHSGVQALMIGWVTFAHSAFIERFEDLRDTRAAALETLDAMIDGWAVRMEA